MNVECDSEKIVHLSSSHGASCGIHRIDCFSDVSTSLFGEKLKEQVEERLLFYEQGAAPRKNSEAMKVCACALTLTPSLMFCFVET